MGVNVLTRSPLISKIFIKQKKELNFDSNEEFLLFLLGNSKKLALIVTQLSPLLNKLLDCAITELDVELSLDDVDAPLPMEYPSNLTPESSEVVHDVSDTIPSSTDLQNILDSVHKNKKEASEAQKNHEKEERYTVNRISEEEALFNEELQKDHTNVARKQEHKRYPCESSGNDDHSDSSYDSDESHEPPNISFQNKSPLQSAKSPKISSQSPHQRKSPESINKSHSPTKSNKSPITKDDSAEEERLLFDPAGLLLKSNAVLQESEEVMNINKPISTVTITKTTNTVNPEPSDIANEPTKAPHQRLVLPRQASPFKSGQLIALTITNELKGISLPAPMHSNVHSSYTEISQHGRSAAPEPPQKDSDQNRENQNNANDAESDASQDKLYICPMCKKEFKGSGRVRNCKIHVNTVHLKHKPYKCNFCNVRFGYKDYMKRHLIRHHKSLFYSYDTESVLEKYTTYDTTDDTSQDHEVIHDTRHDTGHDTSHELQDSSQ